MSGGQRWREEALPGEVLGFGVVMTVRVGCRFGKSSLLPISLRFLSGMLWECQVNSWMEFSAQIKTRTVNLGVRLM